MKNTIAVVDSSIQEINFYNCIGRSRPCNRRNISCLVINIQKRVILHQYVGLIEQNNHKYLIYVYIYGNY